MANEYKVALPIGAPAQRVWDLLVDAPGYKRWNSSVVSIDGLIAAQRTIKLVSAVNPGRTFVLKVTAMDPPHRMVWSGGMPLGLFTGTRTFVIEAAAGGADSRCPRSTQAYCQNPSSSRYRTWPIRSTSLPKG
jgi:uncharacterized protein YndB with AHSA1/START domain